MKKNPYISIIVPTYNEERNILRLLTSIDIQIYRNFEIIIVDQQSVDLTVTLAKKFTNKIFILPKPKFYTPPGKNRNLGARQAKGDVLLHIDADMEFPNSSFLSNLINSFSLSKRAIILHEKDIAEGYWNRCKALERMFYWNTEMESARAVTKELFDSVGGYDVNISSGEDFFISGKYSQKTNLVRSDVLFINHHTGNISLSKLLIKKFNYGKSVNSYIKKVTSSKVPYPNIINASFYSYLKNYRYILIDTLHYIGIPLLRIMEYLALSLGRIYTYARIHIYDK